MLGKSAELQVGVAQVAGEHRRGEERFPHVYACRDSAADLASSCAWAGARAEALLDEANRCGAILFRGFPLATPQDFDAFVTAFGRPAFTYEDSLSNAVRMIRTPRVFTANEAPPNIQIFFHHEMAQTPIYPTRLFFFCEHPAESGGATPICRSDWLFDRLQNECPQFVAEIEAKGLRYSNVMPGEMDLQSGMGRSWQSTLKSTTREAAEKRLRDLGYSWQWQDDGCLRATTPVMKGIHVLPDGRRTFFNQLIAAYCGWKDTRNDPSTAIKLGDGTPLDRACVQTAIEIAEELAFDLP